MSDFATTDLNRLRRVSKRGYYDRETVYAVVDAALICHVAFVQDGQPVVIPTLHARDGDTLLLHGASTSRLMQHASTGAPLSVAVSHVDGIVLARSLMHHSVNYRSTVLFGHGRAIDEPAAKNDALRRFTEKLIPGRWDDARLPTANELRATAVVAMPIDLATAKIRTGGPVDDDEDYALPYWAGVLPQSPQWGAPLPDERLAPGTPLPDYITALIGE